MLVLALVWAFQRRLIYLPDRAEPPPVIWVLPEAREVTLNTWDGLELGAWYFPPRGADRQIAVLVAPGNAGNRAYRAPLARALAVEGLAVLLLDYRGYGGNPGSPTERGLARDVRAAHRYLVEVSGVPPHRQIYFGESLGAGVVAELATEHEPGGLLLRSPFADLAAVARVHYPVLPARLLLRDRYPVTERIAAVTAPTVVVYGTADGVVPPAQSRAVAAAAPGLLRTVPVEGADHNDPALLDGDQLVDAVVGLADTADRRHP
ncbi:MAG: alpha/beta hydrolase [Pseudonocardiaceae bacterium]